MRAGEISLSLKADGEQGSYAFTCPECRVEVSKPANRKTVALLIAAGVEAANTGFVDSIDWTFPLDDQSPMPEAAAFTMDDVISFHFLLEDDEAIAELFSFES